MYGTLDHLDAPIIDNYNNYNLSTVQHALVTDFPLLYCKTLMVEV